MIEETGIVVAIEDGHVWVETQVKTTCSACKASNACPTSTIAKAFTPKENQVRIAVPCQLVVGQQVKVGVSERAILQASLVVYIVPLLALILVSAGVTALLPNLHELVVLCIASLAALAGFWWASVFAKQPQNRAKFMPVFLGATQQPVVTYKHEIPILKID